MQGRLAGGQRRIRQLNILAVPGPATHPRYKTCDKFNGVLIITRPLTAYVTARIHIYFKDRVFYGVINCDLLFYVVNLLLWLG